MAGTQAIDRTMEIVRQVVQTEGPTTFTQLVHTTGLPRSTVSRMLQALEAGGLLERDPGRGYRGGWLFAEYAMRFDRVEVLVDLAHVHLEDLAEETGETATMAVPQGSQVVQADQVDARYALGLVNWMTIDVPSHCSALGKVLHAWGAVRMPSGRLEVRTSSTVRTHPQLEAELELTRSRGYALTRGEFEVGLDGVGVPVRGDQGSVVAAIGVSGPTFRIGERRPDIAGQLQAHASRITREIAARRRR